MNSKKKTLILGIVAVATLAVLIVGATYAYFQAQGDTSKSVDIKVGTATTDVFTFKTGNDISINAYQSNFAKGQASLSSETTATATLTANNSTNSATYNYYVYVNITNNSFIYSNGESKPELILTVIGPDNKEVTTLDGLTHIVVTDNKGTSISGFDVTTKSGLITLANNKEIVAGTSSTVGKATTEEEWIVKLTFVNYNADQSDNAGSSLNAEIMIQKEKIVQTVANICESRQTLSSCIIAMNGVDDTLYYHNGSLENGINDNSYRYAGASSSVNNYVCFGSDEAACPTDNLYRIIGVFGDQVKLIKADFANSNLLGTDGSYSSSTYAKSSYSGYTGALDTINRYYWNIGGTNTWSESNLNTVNLNTNFYNSFDETWKAKIAKTTWKVRGNTWANIGTVVPKTAYVNEITSPQPSSTSSTGETEYSAKIGLMYVTDYEFAASQSAWTLLGYSSSGSSFDYRSATSINWMYMGIIEWTISRRSDNSDRAFYVFSAGNVTYGYVDGGSYDIGVRPVFYLVSTATYSDGTGTSSDPIRIG